MNNRHFWSLKSLLALDAASCAVLGVALIAAAEPVATLTQIPQPLLASAGAILLPVALFMGFWARAFIVPRWAILLVVTGNIAWAALSILLPLIGLIEPNSLGWAILVGQAVIVAILAVLEAEAPAATLVQAK